MKNQFSYLTALVIGAILLIVTSSGCQESSGNDNSDSGSSDVVTPVTITSVSSESMADTITLNATSAYLIKSFIKANATGYLQMKNLQPGQLVKRGVPLFSIRTKESTALGNSIDVLDSSFHFSGVNRINSNLTGFILHLDHQSGDYVLDGEQLAVVAASNSFVFLMEMPYELKPLIDNKKRIELVLPDGEHLTGVVERTMPVMDSIAQTQQVVLRVNSLHSIPENLIAQAKIIRNQRSNAPTLPKAAVLTDETQTEFWVMKMINDSTSVKVPVKIGMEAGGQIEILSPSFGAQDRILLTGNFGLPDTAKVSVIKK